MPNRRAVVVVLSTALLAGAVAGGVAASSHLDPWGLRDLMGIGRTADAVVTRGPTPTPTVTVTVPPRPQSSAGSTPVAPEVFRTERIDRREIGVPVGWRRLDQSADWHDFLDPTLNLRLRIRFGTYGGDAKAAAEAAFAKRSDELSGFGSPGVDRVARVLFVGTPEERTVTYYEFRYTSKEQNRTRYGVEWYLDGTTMIGGFGWAGEHLDLVEPAMDRALGSLLEGAGDA